MRSDCGRAKSSVHERALNRTRSAAAPAWNVRDVEAAYLARRSREGERPVVAGMVEMADAGGLAHHLDHVEVAIGVERVARVVGGEGDRDGALGHLVDERDAAPAWGPLASGLEVEVAHRQRDDGDLGLRHQVERAPPLVVGLHRERAAMADRDGGIEVPLDHRLGDGAQGGDGGVARLVGVKVDRQAAFLRESEEAVEARLQVGHRIGDRAQHAAALGDQVRGADVSVVHMVDADEAGGLQRDAAGPFLAQLAPDRPGNLVLRRQGIEMGADGAGAVGVGRAQREVHAGAYVVGRPVRRPVRPHALQRAHERAVGVRRAAPDVALVEMGVHVGEAGQRHRALHVQPVAGGLVGEAPVADGQREGREVAVPTEEAGRHRQVVERDVARGKLGEIAHVSRFSALSCHSKVMLPAQGALVPFGGHASRLRALSCHSGVMLPALRALSCHLRRAMWLSHPVTR